MADKAVAMEALENFILGLGRLLEANQTAPESRDPVGSLSSTCRRPS